MKNYQCSQNNFYHKNQEYSNFLESHDENMYQKYIDIIKMFSANKKVKYLDVGCGTGKALQILKNHKKISGFGIEVSKTSLEICKKKRLNVSYYNGKKIPYKARTFDIVGSNNVLEHTDSPTLFLSEKKRVLKKNGFLVVACPNFYALSNNYHAHTRGLSKKLTNLIHIVRQLIKPSHKFDKMSPIINDQIEPDDDAVNVTNPQTLKKWANLNSLDLCYWSSQLLYDRPIMINLLDKTPAKLFLGAMLMVFIKK